MNTNLLHSKVWRQIRSAIGCSLAVAVATSFTGCSTLTQPINGIPAHRLSPDFFPPPKNDLVPVDIALLSLEPPRDYQLGPDDILGVYIEGVLPFNPPNAPPEPPPVNFPEKDSTLPPSIGYPIAVQDDGTLALPLIEPLKVEGLTLEQVREKIRQSYIENDILREEKARPIVTLIRERTFDVIVVREDSVDDLRLRRERDSIRGNDSAASGGLVKLPAYKNDVLHALVETGGLPGLNAKNEVLVLRASEADKRKRADFLRKYWAKQRVAMADPCYCPPELPEDPSILRIPLRVRPGVIPNIKEADITLQDGDIVYIENRETEVFYTGGLLPGGEHLLPRDYDLDVLGAMAMAGKGVGSASGTSGGGLGGVSSVGGVPPGMLYILRKTPCNGQIAIEVDLAKAVNDPRSRPLVQPGDTLILQYKCEEEILNFGLGSFFTYGIQALLQNSN
ncbi:polysaccharide biosynthesis/export family protein [Aporhodopirellula aestuarii]|uniref:Polysaccharide biosynthesis/export family protein n=1 Tax=Aporhodopirellula aestuarii TaxID=2950107 RepID=A0ABT0UA28_9BACT|nr:polysaccharide biosynthesis/export family protein [Aporhodopirellula aestuarii]MCM2373196.1 polysaccharide biosynthesis/export family protein [Aporhodopirellula aestuarii]